MPADHRQEVLRKALSQVSSALGPKYILRKVKPIQGEKIIGPRALKLFIDGFTKELEEINYQQLARAWIWSAAAVAVRTEISSQKNIVFELFEEFLKQEFTSAAKKFVGRYYMYYGSYVRPDRYSVRVIDVALDEFNTAYVTDCIRDLVEDIGRVRRSYGSLAMFDGLPQFLLKPQTTNETKIGFTLMVTKKVFYNEEGKAEKLFGSFLTKLSMGTIACRDWMMVLEQAGDREEMIKNSGAFLLTEVTEKHLRAFSALKNQIRKDNTDPMDSFCL